MGLDTSSLEDRIAAFDNICLWGGFPIKQPINRMLIYVSEPALHHSCCHSSKQDDSASSGTWHGWVTRKTCLEPYITSIRRLFKDWRRRPGARTRLQSLGSSRIDVFRALNAQDVHVTPGYRLWKQTFSRSTSDWIQHGDLSRRMEAACGNGYASARGFPAMMMMVVRSWLSVTDLVWDKFYKLQQPTY